MARTLEPNIVLDNFLSSTDVTLERYQDIYAVLGESDRGTLNLRKSLTVDLAFRLGSEWEVFQHQWFVAAIHKKPHKFRGNLAKKLAEDLKKAGAGSMLEILAPGSTSLPTRLSAEQIERLVDPEGYNVSFKDNETWVRKAALDLDPAYTDKVRAITSSAEDACVIDLAKGLRNAIAHGSGGSLARLNQLVRQRPAGETIGLVGEVNASLVRDQTRIKSIATYLHRWGQEDGGLRRVGALGSRIKNIAEKLRL